MRPPPLRSSRNAAAGSRLYTDRHSGYTGLREYTHASVSHSLGEYVRGRVTTNASRVLGRCSSVGTLGRITGGASRTYTAM